MWNQVSCNKVLHRKSLEKENSRLLESLRNTKSSLRSTNHFKPNNRSKSSILDKNWELIKQNKKISSRIQTIKHQRFSNTKDRGLNGSVILRQIENNKKRAIDLRQKSIEKANQKLMAKIISANSSLKSIRVKTQYNQTPQKLKQRPILFICDNIPSIRKLAPLSQTVKNNMKTVKVKSEGIEELKQIKNPQQQQIEQNLIKSGIDESIILDQEIEEISSSQK